MTLPSDILAIRTSMLERFPPPFSAPPSEAKDEAFRQWCLDFAEQVVFAFPQAGYGVKRADPTRPISKDTLARQYGGQLLIWDLFGGVGTATTTVVPNPESQDVTGQTFVAVDGVDHLGDSVPEPPETACQFAPGMLEPIYDRLDALEDHIAMLEQVLNVVLTEIRLGGWPVSVSGKVLFSTVTLKGTVGAKP